MMTTSQKSNINWLYLLLFVIMTEAVGIVSSLFSGNVKQIYNSLLLPPLSPPDFIFGPVWSILYALIGVAGYLAVSQSTNHERPLNITLFFGQLTVNFFWSIIFFGAAAYWISFVIIVLLDGLVIMAIAKFNRTSHLAAWLLVPYLFWILFATYLNVGVAWLN
ncbi:tryptophan-rich sensory protein [Secundilactobacillus kimchicus JCM 15530]|uniref:Tryptophan-rich sensory protein n=1 Tax=Secundilactobacillus kimchicus JCM 15530 TaxID=1302272 RepID=A0A0R1HS69_9LACO|nr:TspO/MBR family protein [Secundilactobacillus kimchicus]KRK49131.1 tryptophan-rich sensory protein [Secundilactobacillus kimchicus JCM 15530]